MGSDRAPVVIEPRIAPRPAEWPVLVPEPVRDRLAQIAAKMGRERGSAVTLGDAVGWLLEMLDRERD